jgi:hypothetical protein
MDVAWVIFHAALRAQPGYHGRARAWLAVHVGIPIFVLRRRPALQAFAKGGQRHLLRVAHGEVVDQRITNAFGIGRLGEETEHGRQGAHQLLDAL